MPLFIGQTHIEIKHAVGSKDRRTSQLGEHGIEPSAVCRSRTDHDRLAEQDRQADIEGPERASSELHRHGLTHRAIFAQVPCHRALSSANPCRRS
jgi:hypothetical protein